MLQGSLVALVTPMESDGSVDWDSLRGLIEFHIHEGTDGIVAVGTTGESATLDEHEHCEVIRFTVETVRGRVPVIAGTGANATTEAIQLTRKAKEVGADACLLVTPYYNKPTQEGLYLHYRAIAEAVDIPQILYNVPGRTGCDMLADTVVRLSKVPNIIGVKEATGNLDRAKSILDQVDPSFLLYSGDDATAGAFCLLGGHGVISVTANVAPRHMHDLCAAARDGDAARVEAIDAKLEGLHRELFVESNPIPVKWALAEMGLIKKGIRLPLTWLLPAYDEVVRSAMRQAGAI
jgi:4-hydroxy-tetrahydrodipicolinate synthase